MNSKQIDIEACYSLLQSNCANCKGLCCKLLYCFKSDGFPEDKVAGKPCRYLTDTHTCKIHDNLAQQHCFGCLRYDCNGAGVHIVELANHHEILTEDYHKMLLMHQILQYILEAYTYFEDIDRQHKLYDVYQQWLRNTSTLEVFQSFDIEAYRQDVNFLLKEMISQIIAKYPKETQVTYKDMIGKDLTKQELQGKDFSMRYMMAANLSHKDLTDAIFLGSDVRDTNICGADLTQVHLLTQMQLNSMLGDAQTSLPKHLYHPSHWK